MLNTFLFIVFFICCICANAAQPDRFSFGRTPTAEEIKQWDFDIMPDGKQLPVGSGTVVEGKDVYQEKCLSCHGEEGKNGINDQLVAKYDPDIRFATDVGAVRTIGNYWPYATTLYDYIYRAMPQTAPGTLTADEVYSLVAYLLFLNEIIDRDVEMNPDSLPKVVMPASMMFYWSEEAD